MGFDFAFHLVAIEPLQHAAWNFTAAKSLDANPLAEIFVGARKLAGDGLGGKLDADFSLHWTYFIDVDFHSHF